MAKATIPLPQAINSLVRIQSADSDGFNYLCWRGFQPESCTLGGGSYVMRRDYYDSTFAHFPEPPPPRFRVEIVTPA